MDIVERLNTVREGMEAGLDDRPIALQIYEYKTAAEEITKLREQVAAQAAEIARLKTVPMKYRRMQFNAELQEEVARLREQVKAQAAVIETLTKRLASTNIIIEVVCAIHPDFACAKYELAENMNALSIPTDSTQILAGVRRAERERVITLLNASFGYLADYDLHQMSKAIRAME